MFALPNAQVARCHYGPRHQAQNKPADRNRKLSGTGDVPNVETKLTLNIRAT